MTDLNRRKNRVLVVEKDFQYRFTMKILFTNGLILLVFGGVVLFVLRSNYEMLIKDALVQMPDMVKVLRRELKTTSLIVSFGLVFMLSMIFMTGLFLTQKIAGPLYAFKRKLNDFASGGTGIRLKLRNGDELQSLESLFNEAMENYDKQMAQTRKSLEEALLNLEVNKATEAQDKLRILLEKVPQPRIFHR